MNRRDLLSSSVALAILPSLAFGYQDSVNSLIEQGFAAQRRGDYVAMESLLRRAVSYGRYDEGVLRGLAWALCRQEKFSEAIQIAISNNNRNPCALSVAGVCETYVATGDFAEARKWLRLAMDHRSEWGAARPIFEMCVEQAAIKTYLLEYILDPAVLAAKRFLAHLNGDFLCPSPIPDLPYQTSTYEVLGARTVRETSRAGNFCLRITPDGRQLAHLRYTVVITPQNYRAQAQDFSSADVPAEIRPLMQATHDVEVYDPTVQELAASLRDSSAIKSIENVCRWSHNNLKYEGHGDWHANGGGTVAVLRRKTGMCEGESSATIGLLRAVGIPARFVRGHGGIGETSGVPSDHTWVEFYVPSLGWIQWDQENVAFTVPARSCIGEFRYNAPYAAAGGGDPETRDLWNFEAVAFPGGITYGVSGNVTYRRMKATV
jgi:transglutaminase-like putative cysteine protease